MELGGRLFEVGANSRLGAYWNKYGIYNSHRQGTDAPATGAANIGGPLT